MSKNLFVVGTGTDIGKTYVAGLLVKKTRELSPRAAYFKAAMSGNSRRADGSLIPGDAVAVREMSGIDQPLTDMCPYVYEDAYSPHLAAKLAGQPVDLARVLADFDRLAAAYDYVTLEGSGGILCPLRHDEQRVGVADFIKTRGFASVLVADAGLGTLNGVGLTAAYMRAAGLKLQGVIFNNFRPGDVLHEDNRVMCEELFGLKTLACVQPGDEDIDLAAQALAALYE